MSNIAAPGNSKLTEVFTLHHLLEDRQRISEQVSLFHSVRIQNQTESY